MKLLAALLLVCTADAILAQTQSNIPVHDPAIIKQDNSYYIYCTGMGITVWRSADMRNWLLQKPVFNKPPQWALQAIPGFKGHIWAPDISYHDGTYYLYYSVSAFGKNTSCIGLATNKTLDPSSKDYNWTDHGKVIESVPGRDMWNAIDPNEIDDEKGNHWLAFGSFWNGIKLVKLGDDFKSIAQPQEWHTIAARQRSFRLPDTAAGDAAIEAPFIFKKDGFYYLFVSFDYCCRGDKSTYNMKVGRSRTIEGPYSDRDMQPMNYGGGSDVAPKNKSWYGAGHNAVANFNGADYLVFHIYDANDHGKPKLRIEKLQWVNGWPIAETP